MRECPLPGRKRHSQLIRGNNNYHRAMVVLLHIYYTDVRDLQLYRSLDIVRRLRVVDAFPGSPDLQMVSCVGTGLTIARLMAIGLDVSGNPEVHDVVREIAGGGPANLQDTSGTLRTVRGH